MDEQRDVRQVAPPLPRTLMRYEYRRVIIGQDLAMLNDLGRKGWRVVQGSILSGSNWSCIMEREIGLTVVDV